jgi:glycerophosphoryl diester phosphodiesterase
MPNAPQAGFERVAHRGAPRERVENTLPGFLVALDRGADALELDVHATADGVVVVHHDDEAHGHILAKTAWSDVTHFDIGGGARIPRLDEVLEAVGSRATVYIELKGFEIEEKVIAVARRHGQRFALHSFDHGAIERVARMAPDIPRGILLDRDITNPVAQLRDAASRTQPRDIWPHWTLATAPLVQAAHDVGARVIAWTVNSEEIARDVLAAGVDALCSDDLRLLTDL